MKSIKHISLAIGYFLPIAEIITALEGKYKLITNKLTLHRGFNSFE
jgi:hypothetical protein